MPFFEGNLHHLGRPQPSLGTTSSFGENFSAAYDQQYKVDSMLSLESELVDRYNENLRKVRERTGEDLSIDQYNLDFMGVAARRQLGQELPSATVPEELIPKFLEDFDMNEARLKELKAAHPDIQTFSEMLEEVRTMRQETLRTSQDLGNRAGVAGTLGGFAGAVVGSFSLRDPLLVGSLFLGGWGASLGRRILTEAGIGATVEGAQQFGFVQPTQQMLNEKGTNPWVSIATAGLGSGLIRGAIEAPAPAYRALETRLAPQRAYARAFEEGLQGPMDIGAFDRAFGGMRDSPSLRASRAAFEAEATLRAANPYGNSVVAQRQFLAELQQTHDRFDGRSSAAAPPRWEGEAQPGFLREAQFDRALAQSEFPIPTARLVEAEARLSEADARIGELEQAVSGRTTADAVELVDEVSGLRVREIEAELQRPGARVAELERELDMIVESIGPDVIAKAEQDWRIGPRRQLASARKSRQAAAKVYGRARREVDGLVEGLRRRDAGITRVQDLLKSPEIQALPRTLEDLAQLRHPRFIQESNARLVEAEARIDETAEAIVARNTADDVEVDVGLPENLSPSTLVPITDDLGNVRTITAKQAMAELEEDNLLIEAMRTCAI